MEIRQIEYIQAIASSGSISKAAKQLNISQPALSQQLQRLEKRYGVQLFYRGSRTLRLTPAGKVFLDKGGRILELQRQADREIAEFSDFSRGSFSVGVNPGRGTTLLADVFPLFLERFPQYNVKTVEGSFHEISEMLLSNEFDIGFNAFLDNRSENRSAFDYRILEREEIFLAISKKHPLAHLADNLPPGEFPTADLSMFAEYGFALTPKPSKLRVIADQSLNAANITPKVVCEIRDPRPSYRIVANTDLCTFIPESYITPSNRQIHFHLSPKRYWDYAICWAPTHYITQAEEYFIQLCYDFLHKEE